MVAILKRVPLVRRLPRREGILLAVVLGSAKAVVAGAIMTPIGSHICCCARGSGAAV